MSRVEAYRGKLVPIQIGDDGLDAWIQNRLDIHVLPNYVESWLDLLHELCYRGYIYDADSDTLYSVEECFELDPEGFVHSARKADGSLEFLVSYYNGGVDFYEVMRSAVRGQR